MERECIGEGLSGNRNGVNAALRNAWDSRQNERVVRVQELWVNIRDPSPARARALIAAKFSFTHPLQFAQKIILPGATDSVFARCVGAG